MKRNNSFIIAVIIIIMITLISCVEDFEHNFSTEEHQHEFINWEISDATCLDPGYKIGYCECGETETVHLEATKHTFSEEYYYDDNIHWRYCTDCCAVDETEHESENGECSVCNYSEVSECDHRWERIFNDKYHWTTCTVCNYVYIMPKEHDLDDWGYCGICGRDVCEHEYSTEYTFDDEFHYTSCALCGKPRKIMHFIAEDLGKCKTCEYVEIPSEGIEYTLSEDGTYAIVTGYTGNDSKLIINNVYMDVPVTHIGEGAFRDSDSITKILIPNSITHIGAYAFADCDGIDSIHLVYNIVYVGEGAFEGCDQLEHVILGYNIETVEKNAFLDCALLDNVYLMNSPIPFEERNIAKEGNERLFGSCFYIEVPMYSFGSAPGYYFWYEDWRHLIGMTSTHLGGVELSAEEFLATEAGETVKIDASVMKVDGWWQDEDGQGYLSLTLLNGTGQYKVVDLPCSAENAEKMTVGTRLIVYGIKQVVDGEHYAVGTKLYFTQGGRKYYPPVEE